nr:hypothetical protein [Verrucomicrobiales bacterium]
MRLKSLTRIDKNARRFGEIVTTLGKYGLADWLSGADYDWLRNLLKSQEGAVITDMTTAERIRCVLTDL